MDQEGVREKAGGSEREVSRGVNGDQPKVEVEKENPIRQALKRALEKSKEEGDEKELAKPKFGDSKETKGKEDNEKRKETREAEKEKSKDKVEIKSQTEKEGGKEGKIPSRSFTPEEKEAFDKAPEVLKKAIQRREKELGNAANALSSKLGVYEKAGQVLDPVLKQAKEEVSTIRALLKNAGVKDHEVTVDNYLGQLVKADKESRRDPATYIVKFAQANGVDLRELAVGKKELAFDEEQHAWRQEFARMQAKIDELEGRGQVRQQQQRQESVRALEQVVARVAEPFVSDMTPREVSIFEAIVQRIHPEVEEQMANSGEELTLETVLEETMRQASALIVTERRRLRDAETEASQKRYGRASSATLSPRGGAAVPLNGRRSVRDILVEKGLKAGIISKRV